MIGLDTPPEKKIFFRLVPLTVSSEVLSFLLTIYCSFFLNNVFWSDLLKTQTGSSGDRLVFFVTIFIAVTTLQFLIINLLLWGRSGKWVAMFVVVATVLADYYAKAYGVHFDTTMLRNIFTTNPAEAKELMTLTLWLHFLQFATIPLLVIFSLKIKQFSFFRSLSRKLILTIILLLISLGALMSQMKNFSATMRNHKEIRHLVLPTSFLFSAGKIAFQSGAEVNTSIRSIGDDAKKINLGKDDEVLVIVVGETVRAANWELSGYKRSTNPLLKQQSIYSFPYAVSCGTNTDTSVPCMFSKEGRRNYDEKLIRSSESLLHVLKKAGFHVSWIDNQSGCKGVCRNLDVYNARDLANPKKCKDSTCYDEALLDGLDSLLKKNHGNQVIVLHQLGNHGPAYYARYPKEFDFFKPTCDTSDLSKCTQQEIVNAYDNSIRYTDAILAKAIDRLKKHTSKSTSLIYLSDHGESLGESGIYLHGLPYSIAPSYQTQVPFFVWLSDGYKKNYPKKVNCLSEQTKKPAHHDNLFHTVLGMLNIETNIYEQEFDLTGKCHG